VECRRIVTGVDRDGKAVVVSDGYAPRTHDYAHIPGMSETLLWAREPGEPIGDGADLTPHVRRTLPTVGGTRFLFVAIPPDGAIADPAAAAAERRAVNPDLAELFEPGDPGMHTSETVDYVVVLDGEIWLEVDDGVLTKVRHGDTVVQNGTRHAWRNHGTAPATLAVVQVGAARDR
jgi:mannose-6-phosphate isomerase-like protein (cupin superfamily)